MSLVVNLAARIFNIEFSFLSVDRLNAIIFLIYCSVRVNVSSETPANYAFNGRSFQFA